MKTKTILQYIIFIVLLYFMFYFSEYFVHRYVMHSIPNPLSADHLIHDKHTMEDMELKITVDYNTVVDKFQGLYFTWFYTGIVFFIGLLEGFLLYFLLRYFQFFKIKPGFVVFYVFFFSMYQSSFWNMVHPDVHKKTSDITWREGVPGWNGWKYIFSSIYVSDKKTLYDWFIENHKMHHLRKNEKKGNYNITLPGADWIMGTMYYEKD